MPRGKKASLNKTNSVSHSVSDSECSDADVEKEKKEDSKSENTEDENDENIDENGSEMDDRPSSPENISDNIKSKCKVEMPPDFYLFWDFCKSINSSKPQGLFIYLFIFLIFRIFIDL